MSQIEVNAVTKRYDTTLALDNVSIRFEPNKIYGLLGRNGAGKTTLLNLITNRIFATEGEVMIDGEPARENDDAQSKIYCMSEQTLYPASMKVKDVFKWTKVFYPDMDTAYAQTLANKFSLDVNKKIKSLSTGYTSIFKIVIALSCNAPIILLDEPVLGLDANFRDLFYKELIRSYADNPRTFVVSTHLIEEAADVIENVIIIKDGRVIMQDTTENVLETGYSVTGKASLIDAYIAGRNVLGQDALGGIKSAYLMGKPDRAALSEEIEVSKMNLQTLFIHLTNA